MPIFRTTFTIQSHPGDRMSRLGHDRELSALESAVDRGDRRLLHPNGVAKPGACADGMPVKMDEDELDEHNDPTAALTELILEHDDDGWPQGSNEDLLIRSPHPEWTENRIQQLPASEAVRDLFRRVVGLLSFCSTDIADGLEEARHLLETANGASIMQKGIEHSVRRALKFWITAGMYEKANKRRNVPGSALALALDGVGSALGCFSSTLWSFTKRPLVQRAAKANETRSALCFFADHLRKEILSAETVLGIGTLGALKRKIRDADRSMRPRTITMRSVSGSIDGVWDMVYHHGTEPEDFGNTDRVNVTLLLALGELLRKVDQHSDGSTPGTNALDDLEPAKLAFSSQDQLQAWKERAAGRLLNESEIMQSTEGFEEMATCFRKTTHKTASCAALLFQLDDVHSATTMLRVLVATVRELFEHDSSIGHRLKLCNALGALSLIASLIEPSNETIRAAEDAIDLLRAPFRDKPDAHTALMATLQFAHACALQGIAAKGNGSAPKALLLCKGYRAASRAVSLARARATAATVDDQGCAASIFLAYALQTKAEVSDAYRASIAELAKQRELDGVTGTQTDQRTTEALQDDSTIARLLADTSRAPVQDSSSDRKAAVTTLIASAGHEAWLIEPLLADALVSYANSAQGEEAMARWQEATGILGDLAKSHSPAFCFPLATSHFDLARQLRWHGRLVEAEEEFKQAIHFRSQAGEASVMQRDSLTTLDAMYAARAMLCFRLGRYEEAMAHAQTAMDIAQRDDHIPNVVREAIVIVPFCKWLLDSGGQVTSLDKVFESPMKFGDVLADKDKPVDSGSRNFLGICWAAVIQCSLGEGEKETAAANAEKVVKAMRNLMDSPAVCEDVKRNLEPIDFRLPHLLVLLAGIHLTLGRLDDALKEAEEVIGMGEKDGKDQPTQAAAVGTSLCRTDGPTLKTALLIKAHLLSKTGDEAGAAAVKAQADAGPFPHLPSNDVHMSRIDSGAVEQMDAQPQSTVPEQHMDFETGTRSDIDTPLEALSFVFPVDALSDIEAAAPLAARLHAMSPAFAQASLLIQRGIMGLIAVVEAGAQIRSLWDRVEAFARRGLGLYERILALPKERMFSTEPGTKHGLLLRMLLAKIDEFEEKVDRHLQRTFIARLLVKAPVLRDLRDLQQKFNYCVRVAELAFGLANKSRRLAQPCSPFDESLSPRGDLVMHRLSALTLDEIEEHHVDPVRDGLPDLFKFEPLLSVLRNVEWPKDREAQETVLLQYLPQYLRNRNVLIEPSSKLILGCLLVSLATCERWQSAADIAEILAITIRYTNSIAPTEQSCIELCSVLGALAVALSQVGMDYQAARAMEEAIDLLHPFHASDLERHQGLLARLRMMQARILIDMATRIPKGPSLHGFAISVACKAGNVADLAVNTFRAAAEADPVDMLRPFHERDPGNTASKFTLAQALYLRAMIVDETHRNVMSHPLYSKHLDEQIEAMNARGDVVDAVTAVRLYFPEYVRDRTNEIGTPEDFWPILKEAIGTFRELAEASSTRYRLFLSNALFLATSLLGDVPDDEGVMKQANDHFQSLALDFPIVNEEELYELGERWHQHNMTHPLIGKRVLGASEHGDRLRARRWHAIISRHL
ncbi:hypothetical protein OC834_006272 [Tilletia horrida]|nr:hypothetical protein OC834_006272 [Tilletia horrida]